MSCLDCHIVLHVLGGKKTAKFPAMLGNPTFTYVNLKNTGDAMVG